MIEDSLLDVKNILFRVLFKGAFDQWYLNNKKTKTDQTNTVHVLIRFDKRKKQNGSMLVRDLIQVISDRIEVTKDSLIKETFYQPTKTTFTYVVLFENIFKNLVIREKIIQHLIPFWQEWEKDGFQVEETNTWNRLDTQQRQIVCDIWNVIGESVEKAIPFEQLIDKTRSRMKLIVTIKEDIRLCINNYCQETCDKELFYDRLQKIETQLNQDKVLSIQVPPEIERLKPFADRLNPVFPSLIWQKYLKHNMESESKHILLLLMVNISKIVCLLFCFRTKRLRC